MRRVPFLAGAIGALLVLGPTLAPAAAQGLRSPEFPVEAVPEHREVPAGGRTRVMLRVRIQSPWHIQANRTTKPSFVPTAVTWTAPRGVTVEGTDYPPGEMRSFAGLDPINVYEGEIRIYTTLRVAADAPAGSLSLRGSLRYQACDDRGICKLPRTVEVAVPLTVVAAGRPAVPDSRFVPPAAPAEGAGTPSGAPAQAGLIDRWFRRYGILALIPIFLAGLAINLTPCVLPIIPVTLGFFGMQAGGDRRKTFVLAVAYVLGMAVTYSALGVIAAMAGKVFGFASSSPAVSFAIAAIIGALSLSMFGLYEIQPPQAIASKARGRQGFLGAMAMGAIVGVVAAPCSGPVVLGLVAFAANSGNPLVGFGLFLTLALGLGLPFLVLGLFAGAVGSLPKSGAWTELTKRIFGVLMGAAAIYFVGQGLQGRPGTGAILFALYFVAVGVFLLVGDAELAHYRKVFRFKQALGLALAAAGVAFGVTTGLRLDRRPAVAAWPPASEAVLESAARSGKPVVLDFGAEWCAKCKELEEKTFSDPRVIAELKRFVYVKADLTPSDPGPELARLRDRFRVQGLPQVVFLGPDGREIPELRLSDFEGPEAFLARLRRVPGG